MSTPFSVLYSIALFVVLAVAIYLAPDEAASRTRVAEPPSIDLPHCEKESHARGSSTDESINHNCEQDRKQKKRASKRVNAPASSAKSQVNADGKAMDIDDIIDKAQRSTRRKSRKPRTASPDAFSQRLLQPKTKATPASVVDLSHKPQYVETPDKPAQLRDYVVPSGDLSSHTSPEPKIRVLNPALAYKWFHTVRCSVFENGRADLLLGHGSVPVELAFMLTLGWVAFEECLEWADGRETAGEGFIALADQNAKGVELILADHATRPSEEEVRAFARDWMKIKSLDDCTYDWALDAEDRKQHGPFGPTLARLAAPNELEEIWTRITGPAVDPESIRLPDNLSAVLQPLLVSRGALRRLEQDNIPTVAQANKCETAESDAESELSEERDHDEADLNSESDGSAPPCYPKIDSLVISSSPVPSPSRDLSPSILSPSTIASPLEEPVGLKTFQIAQVNPTHTSDELGGFSEDSDMEDDTAVWPSTGFPTPDNSLSLNFDFDSIPFICCEETDVDMLPVQELSADCDLRVMAVDPYIAEPPAWYSSNVTVVVDTPILDDEMQEAVPIPLPEPARQPLPRSSSIATVEMQDATSESIPHKSFIPPPLQYVPQITVSSPSAFVPSPSTNHISREPAVASQSQPVMKPPRPAVFSAPEAPLWPPRRPRANALLEPSATATASTSSVPVRRGLQRSTSAGGLGAAPDAGHSLPDYKDDDDDKENIVAKSAGSSKAEVRTAPSSPVLASTFKGKGKAVVQEEYVETDVSDSESDDGSFVEHTNKPFESVCETRVIDDPQVTAYFRSLGINF